LDCLKKEERYADIPVIILSALADEMDVVRGLDYGAVDYIGKPFSILEFMSRVRSNLRKVKPRKEENNTISVKKLVIDKAKFTCTIKGQPIALTAKEFELLTMLVENKSHVISRAELLKRIWGFDDDIETRTLDMHIKTLREKISRITSEQYIVTVRSVGYVIYDEE
ncbi:MAG: response regulator transcription factor, partial [Corallococcus sp.]|nr:response regulator transcription factor [Corallococcus sp.]